MRYTKTVGALALIPLLVFAATMSRSRTRLAPTAQPKSGQPRAVVLSAPGTKSLVQFSSTVALTYVSSFPELVRSSPVGRSELLRKLTTPAAFDAQSVQLQETIDRTSATFGSNVAKLSWVEGPITSTVERKVGQRVTVAVWTVAIVGSPEMLPQQMWRTFHVTVIEVGGVWLVDDVSSSEGPTPTSPGTRLPGKPTEFVTVATWEPVVKGQRP